MLDPGWDSNVLVCAWREQPGIQQAEPLQKSSHGRTVKKSAVRSPETGASAIRCFPIANGGWKPPVRMAKAHGLHNARSPNQRRWGQPGQQQGRRLPFLRSAQTRSIRFSRVLSCFASSTQQIHSLRARGVRSSHNASAARSADRVFSRSSGTSCTTPEAILLFGFISMASALARRHGWTIPFQNARCSSLPGAATDC